MPVAFSPQFVPMQRLYFTLEAMNLVDKLHAKVFQAFHVEQQPLTTPPAIIEWVAKQGVDRAKFTEIFDLPATGQKAQRAVNLQDAYGVEALAGHRRALLPAGPGPAHAGNGQCPDRRAAQQGLKPPGFR